MLVVSWRVRTRETRGTIVTLGQHEAGYGHEANHGHDFAIYLALALVLLIGISGTASILDGFVHWTNFFKGILDIYRASLREPISWAVQLVWPALSPVISSRAIDLFVIWSAFYLAVNIGDLKINGKTFIRNATAGSSFLEFIAIAFFSFVFIPLVVLYIFAFSGKHMKSNEAKVPLIYVVVLIAVVAGLAVLNWQLQRTV
jgi:hypothetical protein